MCCALQSEAISFPHDFFEDTLLITHDVQYSVEPLPGGNESAVLPDSPSVKRVLTEAGSFLDAGDPLGMQVIVQAPDVNIVVVGLRLHVGSHGSSYAPSEVCLRVFICSREDKAIGRCPAKRST